MRHHFRRASKPARPPNLLGRHAPARWRASLSTSHRHEQLLTDKMRPKILALGGIVMCQTESAMDMRIHAGPLITIIVGFIIVAVGIFWHIGLARTEKAAPRGVTPPSISQASDLQPSSPKGVASAENIAASDTVVKSPIADLSHLESK